jgi:phosphoglycolate phosphatase-like HAD superfamily hydrolase
MRHVVWDWNGTLFDDQHLVLDGLNAVLDHAGVPRIDLATYQRYYTRPVQRFYERVLGRTLAPDEWADLDARYHDGYAAALRQAGLAADADRALDHVEHHGGSQSLLSMWRHRDLIALTAELGVAHRFTRIDGLVGPGGGHKAPHLVTHLARVVHRAEAPASQVVLIGDALDDAAAAHHVGVDCVLYDGGSHPRQELERAGVPVASTLLEAVELAGLA